MFPGFALIMMVRFGNTTKANVLTFGLLIPMFIICSGVCKMAKLFCILAYISVLIFSVFAIGQQLFMAQNIEVFCKVFGG
jgi:hypothetical protein